jgi:hypothetical protein
MNAELESIKFRINRILKQRLCEERSNLYIGHSMEPNSFKWTFFNKSLLPDMHKQRDYFVPRKDDMINNQ